MCHKLKTVTDLHSLSSFDCSPQEQVAIQLKPNKTVTVLQEHVKEVRMDLIKVLRSLIVNYVSIHVFYATVSSKGISISIDE